MALGLRRPGLGGPLWRSVPDILPPAWMGRHLLERLQLGTRHGRAFVRSVLKGRLNTGKGLDWIGEGPGEVLSDDPGSWRRRLLEERRSDAGTGAQCGARSWIPVLLVSSVGRVADRGVGDRKCDDAETLGRRRVLGRARVGNRATEGQQRRSGRSGRTRRRSPKPTSGFYDDGID